jgi:hypothetical protein
MVGTGLISTSTFEDERFAVFDGKIIVSTAAIIAVAMKPAKIKPPKKGSCQFGLSNIPCSSQ